ncbi:hypothetical protein [Lysobacter sp. CA199]|uniref:hypothetical protein n=1 Tax=Lysobacter sp. CA199 TaxID=3455608 RepID=UPI003F8D735A
MSPDGKKLTFAIAAVMVLGTMSMVFGTMASAALLASAANARRAALATDERRISLAHYARIATVLQHPRCMNCHTVTDFPRQGDDGHPHIMQVKRGPHDSGTPALQCTTCHQRTNSASGVPGNAVWHLAPLRMGWEGLSAGEICRSLTDPKRGGMTHERLIEHLATDPLVAWAWNPGVDLSGKLRSMPPISHADFGRLVRDWVASGAICPD